MKIKSRFAHGLHMKTGKIFDLGDTVAAALKANTMVRDYEQSLIENYPQLEITFKIEPKGKENGGKHIV